MTYRAVSPWIGTLREMRRLEREGPYRYRADAASTALYSSLERAYFALKRRDTQQALAYAADGARNAPGNPLFDYVEAGIYWERGDRDRALKAIRSGNAKGILHLYASLDVPPDRWQWPQFDLIRYTAKKIAGDPHTDEAQLNDLVVMGHKMIWCEPSDPVRLLQGVDVRQAAAQRLERTEGNRAHPRRAELYRELIEEGRALRAGIRRLIDQEKPFHDDARAWIIVRAIRSSDPRFREIAALVYLEKQAEWAAQLRSRYLRSRNLEELKH